MRHAESSRIWSLLDVMEYLDVERLFRLFNSLETYECAFVNAKMNGRGGDLVSETDLASMQAIVKEFELMSHRKLMWLAAPTRQAGYQLAGGSVDVSTAHTVLNSLKGQFVTGLGNITFIAVKEDQAKYLDNDCLFGVGVSEAFPSSARDLQEAGNCLGVECGTAAVFHLMRAVEFALRTLARDRKVAFSDKPLEEKEWGHILSSLEVKVSDLRRADRRQWPSGAIRDEQIRFYGEVVQELRGFNDVWRRHVSHADQSAFYEWDTALGIFKHVRTFMQKLAGKISEDRVTSEFWTEDKGPDWPKPAWG